MIDPRVQFRRIESSELATAYTVGVTVVPTPTQALSRAGYSTERSVTLFHIHYSGTKWITASDRRRLMDEAHITSEREREWVDDHLLTLQSDVMGEMGL